MKHAVRQQNASESRRAISPEVREDQLISLAIDLAEEQLRNGTASSQVITHFLKLGSSKERTEQLKMEKEILLLNAKTEALQSQKRMDELYENAITAMRSYSSAIVSDEEDEYN